ncbi:hypothetical protein CLOM_g12196 [Closterium sp. NIES-68]|nr:hypothetical protein CLOM_g12196 [Closterium sp. NIES-68]GJP72116.1 hypothetical protein CLOP_g2881 [Closterium sp. NIES-67]
MDDPEALLPAIGRRTRQLRQQEQMLREAVTGASRRKETSAAARRAAREAHQQLLRARMPALNAQANAELGAMEGHAAAIAAFLSHPPPAALAMFAGLEPLLEAQEAAAVQHEAWKRRQLEQGPSRAVAAEELERYSPCDLNDLDGDAMAGVYWSSRGAIHRRNIEELKHVHDLAGLAEQRHMAAMVDQARWTARGRALGRAVGSSSSGGSTRMGAGMGRGGVGGLEERMRRRQLDDVQAEVARVRGVVNKLCVEKARLQDTMVTAGDYGLKIQRQRFYMDKMQQLLTQQYWQLAANVALHGAFLLDMSHLERTMQLMLQLHCDTSAALRDSETRKAAYRSLAAQATAPIAHTIPPPLCSSHRPFPPTSPHLPAPLPLWPALLSALSSPTAQGAAQGAAGGGEGESAAVEAGRRVEELKGRAEEEGERVQQGMERTERLLGRMAHMQAALLSLLSSARATPSSTAAHAMPLHLSPPALVDERLRVERQLSDEVAPAVDRLADEWQTAQRSAAHAASHGIRQRVLRGFFTPGALPQALLLAQGAQGGEQQAQGQVHGQRGEPREAQEEDAGRGRGVGTTGGSSMGASEGMGMEGGMDVGMGMGMEDDDETIIF